MRYSPYGKPLRRTFKSEIERLSATYDPSGCTVMGSEKTSQVQVTFELSALSVTPLQQRLYACYCTASPDSSTWVPSSINVRSHIDRMVRYPSRGRSVVRI